MTKRKKLRNKKYKISKILVIYYQLRKHLKDIVDKVYNNIYFQFSINFIIFIAIIFFVIIYNPTTEVLLCNQNLECSVTKEYIYIFKNQKKFYILPNAKLSMTEVRVRPSPINIKGHRNPYIHGCAKIFYKAKITESNLEKQIFTKHICFCNDYQRENCRWIENEVINFNNYISSNTVYKLYSDCAESSFYLSIWLLIISCLFIAPLLIKKSFIKCLKDYIDAL